MKFTNRKRDTELVTVTGESIELKKSYYTIEGDNNHIVEYIPIGFIDFRSMSGYILCLDKSGTKTKHIHRSNPPKFFDSREDCIKELIDRKKGSIKFWESVLEL